MRRGFLPPEPSSLDQWFPTGPLGPGIQTLHHLSSASGLVRSVSWQNKLKQGRRVEMLQNQT